MTRTKLFNRIVITVIAIFLLAVLGAWLFSINSCWYNFYRDIIPLIISAPTAYLAFCFQKRFSFLRALLELWGILIPSIQSAIQYTHLENPSEKEFASTIERVSSAIDSVRGVFSNIPTKRMPSGLYPFENLKDISKLLSWLHYNNQKSIQERAEVRKCIVNLWQELYLTMLNEFDRSPPIKGVSKYLFPEKESIADLFISGNLKKEDLSKHIKPSHPRSSGEK